MKQRELPTPTSYTAPMMEIATLVVESGFAASGSAGWEDGPAEGDNTNDMGEF